MTYVTMVESNTKCTESSGSVFGNSLYLVEVSTLLSQSGCKLVD
jgi:hypothetical protein